MRDSSSTHDVDLATLQICWPNSPGFSWLMLYVFLVYILFARRFMADLPSLGQVPWQRVAIFVVWHVTHFNASSVVSKMLVKLGTPFRENTEVLLYEQNVRWKSRFVSHSRSMTSNAVWWLSKLLKTLYLPTLWLTALCTWSKPSYVKDHRSRAFSFSRCLAALDLKLVSWALTHHWLSMAIRLF